MLHRRDEVVFVPRLIDQLDCRLALNACIKKVGVLRRRMITPDRHIGDVGIDRTGFLSDLRDSTIMIKTRHSGELAPRDIRCIVHGDECIRIRGITDH